MPAAALATTTTERAPVPRLTREQLKTYYAPDDGAGSLFGAMAALSLSVSHTSVRCRTCKGSGAAEISGEELQKWATAIAAETDPDNVKELRRQLSHVCTCPVCRGCGYTTQRRADRASAMDKMFTTVRCGRCRGCGETVQPSDASAERGDICLACGGDAYIVPITARARGSSNGGGGGGGDHDDDGPRDPGESLDVEALLERGRVSQAIDRVAERDPEVAAGLASYFGPAGEEYDEHPWGRVFALYAHTAAGTVLANEHAQRSTAGRFVEPLALIAAARHASEQLGRGPVSLDAHRVRILLATAKKQAAALCRRLMAEIDHR